MHSTLRPVPAPLGNVNCLSGPERTAGLEWDPTGNSSELDREERPMSLLFSCCSGPPAGSFLSQALHGMFLGRCQLNGRPLPELPWQPMARGQRSEVKEGLFSEDQARAGLKVGLLSPCTISSLASPQPEAAVTSSHVIFKPHLPS